MLDYGNRFYASLVDVLCVSEVITSERIVAPLCDVQVITDDITQVSVRRDPLDLLVEDISLHKIPPIAEVKPNFPVVNLSYSRRLPTKMATTSMCSSA